MHPTVYKSLDHSRLNVIGAKPDSQPLISTRPPGYGLATCLGFAGATFAVTALVFGLSIGIPFGNSQSTVSSRDAKIVSLESNIVSLNAQVQASNVEVEDEQVALSTTIFDQTSINKCFGTDRNVVLFGGNWASMQVATQITAMLLIELGFNATIQVAESACDYVDYAKATPTNAKNAALKPSASAAYEPACKCNVVDHDNNVTTPRICDTTGYYYMDKSLYYEMAMGLVDMSMEMWYSMFMPTIKSLQSQQLGGGISAIPYENAENVYGRAIYRNKTIDDSCNLTENMLTTTPTTAFTDIGACTQLQGLGASDLTTKYGNVTDHQGYQGTGPSASALTLASEAVGKVIVMEEPEWHYPGGPGVRDMTNAEIKAAQETYLSALGYTQTLGFEVYVCHWPNKYGWLSDKCAQEARDKIPTYGCTFVPDPTGGHDHTCVDGTWWPSENTIFVTFSPRYTDLHGDKMLYVEYMFAVASERAINKMYNTALPYQKPCAYNLFKEIDWHAGDLPSFDSDVSMNAMSPDAAAKAWLNGPDNRAIANTWKSSCNYACIGDKTALTAAEKAIATTALK